MSPADLGARLEQAWATTSPLEAGGALLGIVYVVLVIRQERLCWLASAVSTAAYLWVFAGERLYLQAALQVYFLVVAAYGWYAWRGGAGGTALPVHRSGWRVQMAGIAGVLAVTAASTHWLAALTSSPQPLLDSLTTWGSVFATWLVARKAIENWAWWLVIDALIMILCWQQRLYATMLLYGAFVALVFVGWRSWRGDLGRAPVAGKERT